MARHKCTAEITLPGGPEIAESLEPDNLQTPPWLKITCTHQEGSVACTVEVEGCHSPRRILSLRNTIDDLLRSYRAATETLEATRK
ncbi:hypothetical protein APE_1147a [Aeropyrum pernix K1]|uniref:KEOPS complex subunit Pcc1 n=1 Tax=Aeropyrum pernix (strain ATCC 700893 / DSM 11879 / JCM 9820 / NBRC 100138 / K1) TaxID=272557 RepID=Q05E27_AERPE|nr:KEOPS complex subunit Pcc1 [Aeropyrum pernix]BAF34774.1 hypothetical protein APE_1147a [Aeropyrum pernix K1]